MTEGRRGFAAEETFAEIDEGEVEATEGSEGEEDGGVGSGIVDGGGDVGNFDTVVGADRDVDLVVAGACGKEVSMVGFAALDNRANMGEASAGTGTAVLRRSLIRQTCIGAQR